MCGYQPGDHAHRLTCPYPLFRGSERDQDAWCAAEEQKRLDLLQDVMAGREEWNRAVAAQRAELM